MRYFIKVLVCFFVIANFTAPVCFAQRQGAHVIVRSLYGGVKEIMAGDMSFVLETDEGDIEIIVTRRAKIFRGTESVDFSDIEVEDEMTVKYYEDDDGKKQVLSIMLVG